LTGQAVANAILFACVVEQPERIQEKLRECLEIAGNLAEGKSEPSSCAADNDDA
jgi:hypothetical protein